MGFASSQCLDLVTSNHENKTVLHQAFPNLNQSIMGCTLEMGASQLSQKDPIDRLVTGKLGLTFDWMTCPESTGTTHSDNPNSTRSVNFSEPVFDKLGLNVKDQHDRQYLSYIIYFMDDFQRLVMESGIPPENVVLDPAITANFSQLATGSKGCKVHLAGGALFWFTIMTTM